MLTEIKTNRKPGKNIYNLCESHGLLILIKEIILGIQLEKYVYFYAKENRHSQKKVRQPSNI